jgi:predicted esterase
MEPPDSPAAAEETAPGDRAPASLRSGATGAKAAGPWTAHITRVLHEHHLTVPRTARYYLLGEAEPGVRDVWIACHGYAQLAAEFITGFEALRDPARLIVAPEALSRFYLEGGRHGADSAVGATWMTREDRLREIEDYVRYLDALHDAVFQRVDRRAASLTVLGFSQGAATASRWVAHGRWKVERLVLWGGLLPPDLDLTAARDRLAQLSLVLVAGRRDRFLNGHTLSEQVAALERHGLAPRTITFPGGHRLDDEVLSGLARG